MIAMIILLALLGNTVIWAPAGHFDYTEYSSYHSVFEGEVLAKTGDSIHVTVTEVWKGDLLPGQQIGLQSDFPINVERGSAALITADSTGNLLCCGTGRNGFFIMHGRTSPNILTIDDLELLSSGETPAFNEHESLITVHFPLTGETAQLEVLPGDMFRRAVSEVDIWNGAYVLGSICGGPRGSTEMVLYPSTSAYRDREPLGTFRGDVISYEDGVYYMEMWPAYPCYPSLRSAVAEPVSVTGPLYCFDIDLRNEFMWLYDIPDETFILSDGRGFFLLNGCGERLSSSAGQRDDMGLGLNSLVFGTAGLDMGLLPDGHLVIELDDPQPDGGTPLLASMIQRCSEDDLTGTVLLHRGPHMEPVDLSAFTMSLDRPEFLLLVSDSASAAVDLDGSSLVFLEDGGAAIEHGGYQYRQDGLQLRVPRTHHTHYPYSMAFSIPGSPDSYIALAFPGMELVWSGADAYRTVAAQLLSTCLKDGSTTCQVWSYHRLEDSYTRLGDMDISIR
mgnify:FL=1